MKRALCAGSVIRTLAAALALLALAGCGSKPPAPQWQLDAHGAAERAVQAYFEGRTRVERAELARARSALSSTGDAAQLARLELLRCAAQVVSLDTAPCTRFAALAADATPQEQAYARYLAGQASLQDVPLLPEAQRAPAAASRQQVAGAIAAEQEPLARLVAAGAAFVRGDASPQVVQIAVDTASRQGWRRPLIAWLGVQIGLAERSGQAQEAARLRRRAAIAGQEAEIDQ